MRRRLTRALTNRGRRRCIVIASGTRAIPRQPLAGAINHSVDSRFSCRDGAGSKVEVVMSSNPESIHSPTSFVMERENPSPIRAGEARWTVLLVTVSTAGFIHGHSEPHQGTAAGRIAYEAMVRFYAKLLSASCP
jgi:hypothetical protein